MAGDVKKLGSDLIGEKLGPYVIKGILGMGAMGVVFRAWDEDKQRAAAIKFILSDIVGKGNSFERFRREAKVVNMLRHPNIVTYYKGGRVKSGSYQGAVYFAMEYIDGKTLEQILAERNAFPWTEVADLAVQVCGALQFAHDNHVVHRDLKPSNMMITKDKIIKLTDFGIAKALGATDLTATGRTLGTAAYMAPEQIRGDEISHKTDLYQLGCVLYQLLNGRLPFEGTSAVAMMHGHLNEERPFPSHKFREIPVALGSELPELPPAMDDLVVRLMAKKAQDRPDSAAEVMERLTEIREFSGLGKPVPKKWRRERDLVKSTTPAPSETKSVRKAGVKRRSAPPTGETEYVGNTRRLLETVGLVALLIGLAGVIGYAFWPPSASYLFTRAEPLMASEDRHDWARARNEYLDKLDAEYPNNPYKEKTGPWRDKLALSETEGRARNLQSQANTGFNKPNGELEERFVQYYTVVSAAEKRNDERGAATAWEEFASSLKPDEKDERPWHLLAKKKAAELSQKIVQRKERVIALMNMAHKAELEGKVSEAVSLRAEVLERYGKFTDVAELLGIAPGTAPEAKAPTVPTLEPAPAVEGGPTAPPEVRSPQ